MKRYIIAALAVFLNIGIASAEYVSGYTRSDGTYVDGYYRTSSNGNPYDNQSYPGNYNYNTGKVTTGSQEKYLDNYYGRDTSSYGNIDNVRSNRKSTNIYR